MKRIYATRWLWAVLLLAGQSEMQAAEGLDNAASAAETEPQEVVVGFMPGASYQKPILITKEEAQNSALIKALLSSEQNEPALLNPEYCAGYNLSQIKQLLGLLAAENAEAIQVYLAEKNDLELYHLYRLADYLSLNLSLQDRILTVLAKMIITQPEPAAPAQQKPSFFNSLKSLGASLWGASLLKKAKQEPVQKGGYDQLDARFIEQLHAKLAFELLANSKILSADNYEVSSVAYSSDGTRIASGSWDDTMRIEDAATGKLLHTLQNHTQQFEMRGVTSVAYSPDGKRIASGSRDTTVRIWNAGKGLQLGKQLRGHTARVNSVAFSPDSNQIASGSEDHTVQIWDASTGRLLHTLAGHTGFVYSVAFSPDGTRIASGSGDSTVRIWDASTGAPVGAPLAGHTGAVISVAWSPDGTKIASGSVDDTMRVWDAATGGLLNRLQGHTSYITSIAYSPDGTRIVSGSGDKTVRIWDAGTGLQLGTELRGHTDFVLLVAFNPEGTQIVSGSHDRTVRIWGESFKKIDERIKRWSLKHLSKELSLETLTHQRAMLEKEDTLSEEILKLTAQRVSQKLGVPMTTKPFSRKPLKLLGKPKRVTDRDQG